MMYDIACDVGTIVEILTNVLFEVEHEGQSYMRGSRA